VFGMSAGEITILLIVGIVVVGPQKLPGMMRTAGQWVTKLRRMSTDLRSQSGIDRIIREEGLEKEIRELRALRESLSKQAMLDSLVDAVNKPTPVRTPLKAGPAATKLPEKKQDEPALDAKKDEPALPEKKDDAPSPGPAKLGDAAAASEAADALAASAPEAATPEANGGPVVSAAAASLIKPPEGATVARGADEPERPRPEVKNPYVSFREREYPSYGPDHYDAMPDDFDDSEEDDALYGMEQAT
jgi:sec-independent protein translocase protein TatB